MQRIASMNSILFYSILFYSILFYSCALRLFSKSGQYIFSQSKDVCRRGFGPGGIQSFFIWRGHYEPSAGGGCL